MPFPVFEQSLNQASLPFPCAGLDVATVYALVLRDGWSPLFGDVIDRALETPVTLADSLGHCRPVYRPIWLYSIAQTLRIGRRPPPAALVRAVESLKVGDVTSVRWTAAHGQRTTEVAWSALARFAVCGDREPLFDAMLAAQQPEGAWLDAGPADPLEMRGYDELVLLHAITSYAVLANQTDLKPAIAANAAFHNRELQPDHATNQPWAIHALAGTPSTLYLAEQLLHAAAAQQPGGLRGLPVVLLADALYGLQSTRFFSELS